MKVLAPRLAATVFCSLTAIAATAAEPKFNRSCSVDKEIHYSIPITKQDCRDLLEQLPETTIEPNKEAIIQRILHVGSNSITGDETRR